MYISVITGATIITLLVFYFMTAGKKVTEDEVENMIESDNPAIFTQDVSFMHEACPLTQYSV